MFSAYETRSPVRSDLVPAIREGVAAMPPAQAFALLVGLISGMIAGVVLCAHGRPDGHPVQQCALALAKVLPELGERPQDCRVETLLQVTEKVGACIWRLAAFQADQGLKDDLESLVAPVCQRVHLVQSSS